MQTIKSGRNFTGYLMFRSKKTNAAVRVFVGPYFLNGYAADGRTPANLNARVACPTGGSWSVSQGAPLYGQFVDEVVCNGKCMNAVSAACECSCGGMNHGAGHGIELSS